MYNRRSFGVDFCVNNPCVKAPCRMMAVGTWTSSGAIEASSFVSKNSKCDMGGLIRRENWHDPTSHLRILTDFVKSDFQEKTAWGCKAACCHQVKSCSKESAYKASFWFPTSMSARLATLRAWTSLICARSKASPMATHRWRSNFTSTNNGRNCTFKGHNWVNDRDQRYPLYHKTMQGVLRTCKLSYRYKTQSSLNFNARISLPNYIHV